MPKRDFDPIHPGEVLLEAFLRPMEITQYRIAKCISVTQRRISEIAGNPDTLPRRNPEFIRQLAVGSWQLAAKKVPHPNPQAFPSPSS